jgi:Uup-like ABC transporter family protein
MDIHAVLERIGSLEQEQADLSRLMGDPELYRDAARARETVRRYEEVNAELESLYALLTAGEEGARG